MGLEKVVELPGFLDYDEVMRLSSEAAIGLAILERSPNYTFCLAGKILEYLMCGTPVLTSFCDHWKP